MPIFILLTGAYTGKAVYINTKWIKYICEVDETTTEVNLGFKGTLMALENPDTILAKISNAYLERDVCREYRKSNEE